MSLLDCGILFPFDDEAILSAEGRVWGKPAGDWIWEGPPRKIQWGYESEWQLIYRPNDPAPGDLDGF